MSLCESLWIYHYLYSATLDTTTTCILKQTQHIYIVALKKRARIILFKKIHVLSAHFVKNANVYIKYWCDMCTCVKADVYESIPVLTSIRVHMCAFS